MVQEKDNQDPEKLQSSSNSTKKSQPEQTKELIAASYYGPIPPPNLLNDYRLIDPTFPDRIIKMAESEQAHRHKMDDQVIEKEYHERRRGQNYALCISIIFAVCSTAAIISGHPVAGSVLGGATLVSLVTVFILGRSFEKDDQDR